MVIGSCPSCQNVWVKTKRTKEELEGDEVMREALSFLSRQPTDWGVIEVLTKLPKNCPHCDTPFTEIPL